VDLFNQVNLSANHDELGVEEFSTISIIIISHILQGRCVNVKKDNQTLPCKSYFTSSLFGSKSHILLKDLLTNIGLGIENSVDKVGTKWLSLQFFGSMLDILPTNFVAIISSRVHVTNIFSDFVAIISSPFDAFNACQ
jgi:hypothetical protein